MTGVFLRAALVGIAAAVASCASSPSASPSAPTAVGESGAVLSAVPAAHLPKGECGMILWTLHENRPAPIFRYVSGKKAEVVVNGARLELLREASEGNSAYGVFERQTFRAPSGLALSITLVFGAGFDGGAYVERALVAIHSPDGWRTVTPTAGLVGCRA
jgi:hypothetical protein